MSNVVQFLEMLAQNPRSLSTDEFIAAVARADLAPAVKAALMQRDVAALNHELGRHGAMCCVVFPADNDEPQEGEVPDADVPDQEATSQAA